MKQLYVLFLIIFTTTSFADVVNDFTGMCGVDGYDTFNAVFTPYEYPDVFNPSESFTCDYFPRNMNAVFVPYEYDGNFTPSDTPTCDYLPRNLNAIYEPMIYNCENGYYLPTGGEECEICPENNACGGGEFNFNEDMDQGIVSCGEQFAPMGSSVCYPHIMHVGNNKIYLKSTKLTVPSLNVKIGNEIFYANITPSDVPMNSGTDKHLKVKYHGNIYSVCDDTITDFVMPNVDE